MKQLWPNTCWMQTSVVELEAEEICCMKHHQSQIQAQDSIDNSLFDFPIGGLIDDDEIQSLNKEVPPSDDTPRADASMLPQEIKEKLIDLKVLLEQDIGTLVQNSDSVRSVFRLLRDHLQQDVQAILIPAAYIESNQIRFNQARQRIMDRQQQENLRQDMETKRTLATQTKDRIDFLEANRSSIVDRIDQLKARRAELAKEMERVKIELETEEKKLSDLPTTIADLKKSLSLQASEAMKLHKSIKPIPGTTVDDERTIDEIDQIRRRALDVITDLLK
ncbi:unnamed protein product [Urochloa humidicola]